MKRLFLLLTSLLLSIILLAGCVLTPGTGEQTTKPDTTTQTQDQTQDTQPNTSDPSASTTDPAETTPGEHDTTEEQTTYGPLHFPEDTTQNS